MVEGFGGIADKRIVLDVDVVPRRCRFCGKTESEATFRDEAQVIPFGLGNRTLLSRGECDSCNHRFGETIEIALQDFVGPLRTLSGIRGRNGVPTYRRRPDSPPIRFRAPKLILMNEEGKDDSVVLHHGSDGKSLSVEVECPPLDLQVVARALARIALFFLRTDADGPFFRLVQWARGEVSCCETSIFELLLPGSGVSNIGLFSLTRPPADRRDQPIVASLTVGCVAYFLPLPRSDWRIGTLDLGGLLLALGFPAAFGPKLSLTEFKVPGTGGRISLRRVIRMVQKPETP